MAVFVSRVYNNIPLHVIDSVGQVWGFEMWSVCRIGKGRHWQGVRSGRSSL